MAEILAGRAAQPFVLFRTQESALALLDGLNECGSRLPGAEEIVDTHV